MVSPAPPSRAKTALMLAAAVLFSTAFGLAIPNGAEAGATLRISDKQEARSCAYATKHGSRAQRREYARSCELVGATDLTAATRVMGSSARTQRSTYQNPVYGFSFPDPGVLQNGTSDYYAYSTGSGFPILHSTDLVNWRSVGKALPTRPSWVVPSGDSHPWAASALRTSRSCPGTTSPGCYLLYYTGLSGQHSPTTDCVAVAYSPAPAGPFSDLGPLQAADGAADGTGRPLGCGDDAGYGNIDPAPFVDGDGRAYLYLSTSRRCAAPTTGTCPYAPVISVIPLGDDLVRASAPRKPLLVASPGTWEQDPDHAAQVENPWMHKRNGIYYLLYSGGYYGASYGMGYATASSPTGGTPYAAFSKAPINPILSETADVLSPGGGTTTKGPQGGDWMVYHARAGSYTQPRTLRIDPLVWKKNGSVTVRGPTTAPQSPAP